MKSEARLQGYVNIYLKHLCIDQPMRCQLLNPYFIVSPRSCLDHFSELLCFVPVPGPQRLGLAKQRLI
jgi:hypothetical protein